MKHNKKHAEYSAQFIICPQCSASDFEINEDGIGTCKYCGTTIYLPKKQTEVKIVERTVYTGSAYTADDDSIDSVAEDEQEIFCKAAIKKSFLWFLPIWIFAWLAVIYFYVSHGIMISQDTFVNEPGTALIVSLVSVIANAVLTPTATICTWFTARNLFIKEYLKRCDYSSMTSEDKKRLRKQWAYEVQYLFPTAPDENEKLYEERFRKRKNKVYRGHQAVQIICVILWTLATLASIIFCAP